MYEALAMQGSAVLIKDAKKNKAYFISKKNVSEWHNGNSKMLPVMDDRVLVDTTPFDNIVVGSIQEYLESLGVKTNIAKRVENVCRNSDIDSLGNLYRLGKASAKGLNDMGEGSIKELVRIYKERFNAEWK